MPGDVKPRAATIGLLGTYLLARLWQLAMLGPPVLTPDTSGYRLPGQSGLFDLELVSFTGHALRPWPLTLLYAIGPNDTARVLLQMALGTIAWMTLAVAIGAHSRRHVITAAVVLALAISPGVSSWDAVLLGESLLVSATAFAVAGVLFLRQGRRVPGLVLAIGATGFLVVCRPVFAPLALLPAALLVLQRPKAKRDRIANAALAALLMLTIGYAYLSNIEIDRQWGREIGERDLRGRTVQQFSILAWSPLGTELIDRMIDDGAPPCLAPPVERSTGAWEWWQAKRVDCAHGLRWVSDNFTGWLGVHLATHPGDARDYFRTALASASHERTDGAASLPSPMMPLVSSLFFGNDAANALVGLGLVAVAMGAVRRTWPAWPLVGLAVAGVVALLLTALLSALDVARVGLSATVLVRLGLILCCLDIADPRPDGAA